MIQKILAKTSPTICPQMTISIPSEHQNLTTIKQKQIKIKPKKIYHPTILKACNTMFKKHPDHIHIGQLSQERSFMIDFNVVLLDFKTDYFNV
jgi:hypothetical protein